MAWIEYHYALRDHWKIQRLADLLGCDYAKALGHISCLWLWCLEYSPKGDLSRFKDSEIRLAARAIDEKFSKKILFEAELITAENKINDWKKHGIKYLLSNRNRMKKYRERLRNRNVSVIPTVPNLTLPYHTKNTPPTPPRGNALIGFEEFWKTYPRKQSKGQAELAWTSLNPSKQLRVVILQGAERAKTSENWRKNGGQFIPYPSTWLRARGWEDVISPPQPMRPEEVVLNLTGGSHG